MVEDAELEVAVVAGEVEDAEEVRVGVAGEQYEPGKRLCTGPCTQMRPALVVAIVLWHTLHSTITCSTIDLCPYTPDNFNG